MASIVQGQGIATENKERGFLSVLKVNLSIFKAKGFDGQFTYWHFDLNCGSGHNDKADCIGSPLAFIHAAQLAGVNRYYAGLCDVDETKLDELMKRDGVKGNYRCFPFHGANTSLIEAIPGIIGRNENCKHAMGTILVDPTDTEFPFDELAWLSAQCPKLDFIVNWNSRVFKLMQCHIWGKNKHTLRSAMATLNKEYWLIRRPINHWTLLIGRNAKIGDHKHLGFYHLDSVEGQQIFNRCNYLNAENPDYIQMQQSQLAMGF